MYTDADQAGSWADVQGMTLRPKSVEFEDMYAMMETYEISKLDINRMYRYIDKYTIDTGADIEDDVDNMDDIALVE